MPLHSRLSPIPNLHPLQPLPSLPRPRTPPQPPSESQMGNGPEEGASPHPSERQAKGSTTTNENLLGATAALCPRAAQCCLL